VVIDRSCDIFKTKLYQVYGLMAENVKGEKAGFTVLEMRLLFVSITVHSRIQSALVFADSLNERKSQFAVPIRTFPSTAPCLPSTLIE